MTTSMIGTMMGMIGLMVMIVPMQSEQGETHEHRSNEASVGDN